MLALMKLHHSPAHWARVRNEVASAITETPLYGGYASAPASEDAASVSAWLASLPTIKKADLRRGFPTKLTRTTQNLKQAMADGLVEIISTSGTTEDRLQLLWEWTWWDPQEREAMRLNARIASAMKATGFSEAVLTTPVCGGSVCHIGELTREERTVDGMLFLNQTQDPSLWSTRELDRMLAEWNELRPVGVEADPAYLAALCRHASERGVAMHSPRYVTVTYELCTRAHRRAAAARIDSPLYSLYGATEAGVLFMECEAGRLHHNAAHSHIELVPVDERARLARVVVSTLGRPWMPLVRYELGDVVRVADGACPCGAAHEGALLERIEGRLGDCVQTSAGLITPAMIDDAVDAADPSVVGWRLDGNSAWTLGLVGPRAPACVRDAVATLLGANVQARTESALRPEGSGKYRLVQPPKLASGRA
jgi:phenylacetate-CoA ligase